jgi:hypothetical protein
MGFKPVTCDKIKAAHINKKGCHPEKEKKPLLKAIADPENLQSKNSAIQTAAQVKTEEDLAQQKIKALKYLGAVGCGCYPGVKEALMDALDDCTEEVRFAAATALIQAAGACCGMQTAPPPPRGLLHLHWNDDAEEPQQPTCGCGQSCCDLEMKKKLADVAFEKSAGNCWKEPSARVRAAAAQALAVCNSRPMVAKETEDRPERTPETIPSPTVPETAPESEPETAPMPPLPSGSGPLLRPQIDSAKRDWTPARKFKGRTAHVEQPAPVPQPRLHYQPEPAHYQPEPARSVSSSPVVAAEPQPARSVSSTPVAPMPQPTRSVSSDPVAPMPQPRLRTQAEVYRAVNSVEPAAEAEAVASAPTTTPATPATSATPAKRPVKIVTSYSDGYGPMRSAASKVTGAQ